MKASLGDLVLVKNTENEKCGSYGVIDEMESEETAITRTKKGKMRRAVNQQIPSSGECLVKQKG